VAHPFSALSAPNANSSKPLTKNIFLMTQRLGACALRHHLAGMDCVIRTAQVVPAVTTNQRRTLQSNIGSQMREIQLTADARETGAKQVHGAQCR